MFDSVLSGKYHYQSFYNGPATVADGKAAPNALLAVPWTPVGTLDVKTDAVGGDVIGTLTFPGGAVLKVTGSVLAATSTAPAGVELRGEGLGAVYQIKGWFLPNDKSGRQVVGTVLSLSGDLARQPAGTAGPFLLY